MIATLTKGSGGTYQVSARRYTDPWGVTRVGASSGSPDQRYCASLGHRQDDESGLTYMRARYYEPTTGRFVSEDPAMDGGNWFVYCENVPTMTVDSTGREGEWIYLRGISMFALLMSGVGTLMASVGVALFMLPSAQKLSLLSGLVSNTAICWSLVVTFGWQEGSASVGAVSTVLAAAEGLAGVIANIVAGLGLGCGPAVGRGLAITAITAATAHSLWLFAYLVQASVEPYDGS
jgi:RHS repeat-associated protein